MGLTELDETHNTQHIQKIKMTCQNTNCKFTEALLMSPIDANSQPGNINFKIYRQTYRP